MIKKREIIMISIIIIFFLITLIILSEKNTDYLTCKIDGEFNGMESKTTLTIKLRKNKLKDMNMEINVKVPENGEVKKEDLINYINYQGKMKATDTIEGVKLTTDMHSGYFDTLGLSTKTKKEELKQTLELQGYTCK